MNKKEKESRLELIKERVETQIKLSHIGGLPVSLYGFKNFESIVREAGIVCRLDHQKCLVIWVGLKEYLETRVDILVLSLREIKLEYLLRKFLLQNKDRINKNQIEEIR